MGKDGELRPEGKVEIHHTPSFEVHMSPLTTSWGFASILDGYLLLGSLRIMEDQVAKRLSQMLDRANAGPGSDAVRGTARSGENPVSIAKAPVKGIKP